MGFEPATYICTDFKSDALTTQPRCLPNFNLEGHKGLQKLKNCQGRNRAVSEGVINLDTWWQLLLLCTYKYSKQYRMVLTNTQEHISSFLDVL